MQNCSLITNFLTSLSRRNKLDEGGSEHSLPWIGGILLAVDLCCAVAVAAIGTHVPLHVGDVVKLGYVAVFLHVWAFVLGHSGEEILNDFVGDKRMSQIELCDIWLVFVSNSIL